jgi:hypothetical protein
MSTWVNKSVGLIEPIGLQNMGFKHLNKLFQDLSDRPMFSSIHASRGFEEGIIPMAGIPKAVGARHMVSL